MTDSAGPVRPNPTAREVRPFLLVAAVIFAAGLGIAIAIVVHAATSRDRNGVRPDIVTATIIAVGIAVAFALVACAVVTAGIARFQARQKNQKKQAAS